VGSLLSAANLLALFTALLVFGTIVTLFAPGGGGVRLESRLKSVASRREELRRRSRQAMVQRSQSGLRHADGGLAKTIVEQLNLRKLFEDPKIVDKLAQAGYRGPKPLTRFYFFRLVSPFALAFVAIVYLYGLNAIELPGNTRLVAVVGLFTLGYYAPNIFLSNQISKRRESIVQAWPDALDLMLICVESGMSIEAGIQKVSQEIGGRSIELAEELTLLGAELSYLPERRMAFEGLARRVNYAGVKAVVTAMIQAERYGTPLGAALRVMAKENRDLRITAAEKKAAALPAKLTVPMIVFLLPVLFVVILGPAACSIADAFSGDALGG
jgi:tight adherence protein C